MSRSPAELLRALPAVDRLLACDELRPLVAAHGRGAVVRELRAHLGELRAAAAAGRGSADAAAAAAIAAALGRRLALAARPYYRRVVNATGVVLHTNLGRAPLAPGAAAALAAAAGFAQRLEVDLDSGRRGGRDEGCADLLVELSGAEAATVVNNNAAATLLVLAALARGRRVLVSRGELVEIGGSYRLPEVFAESGAVLAEVGTTNRTHRGDYRAALEAGGEVPVGMILKVHPSNFRVIGFTAEAGLDELVELGREFGVPVVHDLGSGCAVDPRTRGLPAEPWLAESIAAGADLVCASGDKLLGGPQAGLLVGRAAAVGRCRRHPLFRALRPGRLIYSALEATLRLYRDGADEAWRRVPVLARLALSRDELEPRARALAARLAALPGTEAEAVPCHSQAGSGSLPERDLPSFGVRLALAGHSADSLAAALRAGDPPVVPRIEDGAVLFDLRTVGEGEEEGEIAAAVASMTREGGGAPPEASGGAQGPTRR